MKRLDSKNIDCDECHTNKAVMEFEWFETLSGQLAASCVCVDCLRKAVEMMENCSDQAQRGTPRRDCFARNKRRRTLREQYTGTDKEPIKVVGTHQG